VPRVSFEPAIAADAEALVAIRIAAMRESLERHGFECLETTQWDVFYRCPPRG
jgi:hypothetical protein